jgi:hypothetical protein
MSEVARILEATQNGAPAAADRLLPLVYDENRMQPVGHNHSSDSRRFDERRAPAAGDSRPGEHFRFRGKI